VADWKAALLAKGNTPRHAELVTSRAGKAFAACGFKQWGDISASRLQGHLAGLRTDRRKADGSIERGLSAQTFNFYLQAVKQFARWMVQDQRATEIPLAHLQGLNVRTDRRHDRRALAANELRWLLDTTEHGPERFGMSGPARAMLYRLAVGSGLRAGELRSLTRASFALEGVEPTVTVAAAYSKHRRQDVQPIRPDLAAKLREHLAGKMPNAPAFNVPGRTDVSRMFQADLADARRAWLQSRRTAQDASKGQASTFLAYIDADGRYADFHSLRHSFITALVMGGVNPKEAQSLARHSVITLTMDRYTHQYAGNLTAALNVLPDLSTPTNEVAKATGTDGENPSCQHPVFPVSPPVSLEGAVSSSLVECCGVNTPNVANATTGVTNAEMPENTRFLTPQGASDILTASFGRGDRVVECAGLENRLARKGHGSSNLPLSACRVARGSSAMESRPLAYLRRSQNHPFVAFLWRSVAGGFSEDAMPAVRKSFRIGRVKGYLRGCIGQPAEPPHLCREAKAPSAVPGESLRRRRDRIAIVAADPFAWPCAATLAPNDERHHASRQQDQPSRLRHGRGSLHSIR